MREKRIGTSRTRLVCVIGLGYLFMAVCLCVSALNLVRASGDSAGTAASDEASVPSQTYVLEDNTGYYESDDAKISESQHPLGRNLIKLSVYTGSDTGVARIERGNVSGYDGYGITGSFAQIRLTYTFDTADRLRTGTLDNGHTYVYSISSDTYQSVGDIKNIGVIGTGAMLFQKKSDPAGQWEWQNKDGETKKQLHTVSFTDPVALRDYSNGNPYVLYTPSGTDLSRGIYIKITFAYELKYTETWQEKNWLGIKKNKTYVEYKNIVETAEFYVVQNSGRVLFHNASNFDRVGEEGSSGAITIGDFETILSGDVTLTGFRLDTLGVEAYDITYTYNFGSEQKATDGQFFLNHGRYDFTIKRKIGDKLTHTVFIDRREVNDAVVGYFGQSLFTPDSQRVYTTGEYPTYLAGARWNLNAVDGTVVPVAGKLFRIGDDGEEVFVDYIKQDYDEDYKAAAKQGAIEQAGTYKAEFWGNPKYLRDAEVSGDLYHFVFRFEIVDKNSPKEPSINEAYLGGLVGFSDLQSKYYSVAIQTAGAGKAIFAFSDYSGAYDFAYEIERGKVTVAEGRYDYNGQTYATQKDVLGAIDEIAKAQIAVRYFDATNPESYQTADVADEKIAQLDFPKDVIVFSDDTEQLYMQAGLPSLNGRKYRYISPQTGEAEDGVLYFAFVHIAGFESESVTLTHKETGTVYDIQYDVSVDYQLGLLHAPSGLYTVREQNAFGDFSEYEAVYIKPGDMTGAVNISVFRNGEFEEIKFDKTNLATVSNSNGFILKSIENELDPYGIVKITHGGVTDMYAYGEIADVYFADGGVYDFLLADRQGNTLAFTVLITDPVGFADIHLELEQPDDEILKDYRVFVGQEIELPTPTQISELYVFEGWLYNDVLLTNNRFRPTVGGDLYVWEQIRQKYTYLNFDSNGGTPVEQLKVEIGVPVDLPVATKNGWAFGGWTYGGRTYTGAYTPTTASPTFTAVWNYIETKIELYDGNLYQTITANVGDKVLLPFPTRTGYTFFGWREEVSDGTNKVYYGQITELANVQAMRLDALWIRSSVIEVSDLADGTGGRVAVYFADGDLLDGDSLQAVSGTNIALPKPSRAGYTFVGWVWRTTPISGKIYTGDNFTVPADAGNTMLLEALWTARQTSGSPGVGPAGTTDNGSGLIFGGSTDVERHANTICLTLAVCLFGIAFIRRVTKKKGLLDPAKMYSKRVEVRTVAASHVFAAVHTVSQNADSHTYTVVTKRKCKRSPFVYCVKYGLVTVRTAVLLVGVLSFMSIFGEWANYGVFRAFAEDRENVSPVVQTSVLSDMDNTNDVYGGSFATDILDDGKHESREKIEEVVANQFDLDFSNDEFVELDLTEDEKFIVSLVLLDFVSMGYDVFPAVANLNSGVHVLGVGYSDYSNAYKREDANENVLCFGSGFVAFPNQTNISEVDIDNGVFIKDLVEPTIEIDKYEEQWRHNYLLMYTESYKPQHFILHGNYFIYEVNGTDIIYEMLIPAEELFEQNKSYGVVYSFDEEKNIYDPDLGEQIDQTATSLNTLLDPVIAKNQYNNYIAEQTANGFTVDTMNFVYISYEALDAYYLSNQDETLLGIDVQEFYDMERTVGSNEYYVVDADGNLTKLEFPPQEEDKASWLDRLCGAVLAIGTICVGVIIVAAVSVVSCGAASAAAPYIMGAFIGGGVEIFMQTVIQGKKIEDINWLRVGVAAVSGVLSAIPGVGWFGAGLIQGVTEAAMTAVDGGSLEDVLKAFTVGFITGVAIHGVSKALSKIKFCFVAGTAVLMANGSVKPIENVQVGDYVRSFNVKSKKFENKLIINKLVNRADVICNVVLSNGETISTTPNHVFYANGKWASAFELQKGDYLIDQLGKKILIDQVLLEYLAIPVPVYNFTVEGNNTYLAGDSAVIVHNSCSHQKAEWKKFRKNFWKSEAGKGSYKNLYQFTDDNIARMQLGKAPFGFDGWPIELHHIDGIANNFTNVIPMSKTQHAIQHMYQRLFGGII